MDQHQSSTSVNIMQFLIGVLLALALFLVELGLSQIFLTNDARCRDVAQSGRIAADPDKECLSEAAYYLLVAVSRGPFASIHSKVPAGVAWIVTGMIYGSLGGILATLARRMAIGIYLGIHAVGLVVLSLVAYISNYIV
jgi:hypothetical protein